MGPGRAGPNPGGPGRAGPSRCRPGPRPAVFGPRIAYKLQIFLRKISNSTDENVAFLVVFVKIMKTEFENAIYHVYMHLYLIEDNGLVIFFIKYYSMLLKMQFLPGPAGPIVDFGKVAARPAGPARAEQNLGPVQL